MSRVLIVFLALLLPACATRPEWLSNRATCTVAQDRALFVSMWGLFGVASVIDPRDAAVMCAIPPEDTAAWPQQWSDQPAPQ